MGEEKAPERLQCGLSVVKRVLEKYGVRPGPIVTRQGAMDLN